MWYFMGLVLDSVDIYQLTESQHEKFIQWWARYFMLAQILSYWVKSIVTICDMDLIKAVWGIQYCQISGNFCPRYILSDLHYKWEQFQEDLHHFPIAAKQKNNFLKCNKNSCEIWCEKWWEMWWWVVRLIDCLKSLAE